MPNFYLNTVLGKTKVYEILKKMLIFSSAAYDDVNKRILVNQDNIGSLKLVSRGTPGDNWLPIVGQPLDMDMYPALAEITAYTPNAPYVSFYSEISGRLYVLVPGTMFVSDDGGATWAINSYGVTGGFGFSPTSITESDDEIVIVGTVYDKMANHGGVNLISSYALRSTDGLNFTPSLIAAGESVGSVCYGAGEFVCVGNDGVVFTSPTGIVWTPRTSGTALQINAVCYGNGLFTAVGSDGVVLTSPDAITWTDRAPAEWVGQLFGVAAITGLTIAVGNDGSMLKSTNGTTFTEVTTGKTGGINHIIYDTVNEVFVFIDPDAAGGLVTTDDAVTLTDVDSGHAFAFSAICRSAGLGKVFAFAVVDPNGKMLSTVDLETFAIYSEADLFSLKLVNAGTTVNKQWIRASDT